MSTLSTSIAHISHELSTPTVPIDYAQVARESLIQAEEIFENFGSFSPENKKLMVEKLNPILKLCQREPGEKFSTDLEEIATRICYIFGTFLYGIRDMEASRQMFLLSLNFQLAGHTALKDTNPMALFSSSDSLESLPKMLSDNAKAFEQVDKYLMDMETNTKEIDLITSSEAASFTAETLRWLGQTYQSITKYQTEEHLPRFEKIYGIAKIILTKLNTQDSQWEIGQILYYTDRFMYNLRTPDDPEGSLATLKSIYPYLEREGNSLRAKVLRAQIHNTIMIGLDKIKTKDPERQNKLLTEQFNEVNAAHKIAETTENFNLHLKLMFKSNTAQCALACLKAGIPTISIDAIKKLVSEVLEEIKILNYNACYHAEYLICAAHVEIYLKNPEAALAFLSMATIVNSKFPENSTSLQTQVESMRKIILES